MFKTSCKGNALAGLGSHEFALNLHVLVAGNQRDFQDEVLCYSSPDEGPGIIDFIHVR